MKYSSVKVQGFRGINKLEVNELRTLNLLVGRNDCGKTSLLESLFLLSGMSNPQLPIGINNFRDLILTSDDDFRFLFHNQNFSEPIVLSAKTENSTRHLKITPVEVGRDEPALPQIMPLRLPMIPQGMPPGLFTPFGTEMLGASSLMNTVRGVTLHFQIDDGPEYQVTSTIRPTQPILVSQYTENHICRFIYPKFAVNTDGTLLERVVVEKQLEGIVRILCQIEPRIVDVRMGANGMIYVDIGTDKLTPLNIMGDGIRKILTLLTAAHGTKDGVLLVDEVENGFHYSSLNVLWKALYAACIDFNVQLFATTHSNECVEAFVNAYETSGRSSDDIRLFRIDAKGPEHIAFPYGPETLRAGLEKGFEVR